MFVQDNLQNVRVVSDVNFPSTKLLLMLTGVVIAPFVLLAIGGRTPNSLWQSGLVWTSLVIALLLLVSVYAGLTMFKSPSYARTPPSIRPNIS